VRVHAVSYEWQRSIGRIARLVHRETARSRGDQGRALAGRKLEAPPDAGHGWREGESVREYVQAIKSSRVFGPWVSARRFKIRLKAFSDSRPSRLYGWGDAGVLWLAGSTFDSPSARSVIRASASGGRRPTRACLRVTMRTSESDTVR